MEIHNEFSGTITLTENSSRELFKVLKEQDEAFINDVLCGRCGFTLKSADGRSVELVPNTNKRCQSVESVESVEADTPQTEEQFCIEHRCTHYYPQLGGCTNTGDCPHIKDEPQTDCPWK